MGSKISGHLFMIFHHAWAAVGVLFLMFFTKVTANAQRYIVTIGDSNGANKQGWVSQLKSIRPRDSIFDYSISGNTIGFDNMGNERLNTLKNIDSYIGDALSRSSTRSIDDIILLLGINDCKKMYDGMENKVIMHLEQLVSTIQKDHDVEIYIVAPPPYGKDSVLPEKYKGANERVRKLLPGYMTVALQTDCHFIDIYHELEPKFREFSPDGVHLNKQASVLVARTISRFLDKTAKIAWDDEREVRWPKQVNVVNILSALDGEVQKAYFYPTSKSTPQPLIVSLHTWSGDYTQYDPLIPQILEKDWNYIHPDFRGINNTPKACGSQYVINDIDEAIAYALAHGNVNSQNVHVIGVSGGGYATLISFMHSRHEVASFSAWVPISDIESWFYQSVGRKNKYVGHILLATSSGDSVLNIEEARKRSPFFMRTPAKVRRDSKLKMYAGVHDGYEGSVPISQSLKFYNKIVKDFGGHDEALITKEEMLDLVSMRHFPECQDKQIGNRHVIFDRSFRNISLVIFEGKHEMLTDVALDLIPVDE